MVYNNNNNNSRRKGKSGDNVSKKEGFQRFCGGSYCILGVEIFYSGFHGHIL